MRLLPGCLPLLVLAACVSAAKDSGSAESIPGDASSDTSPDRETGDPSDTAAETDSGLDTSLDSGADTGLDTGTESGCLSDVDCDDGDPCSVDACDTATGACSSAPFDGDALGLWDMAALTDPSSLDLDVVAHTSTVEGLTVVDVYEVRYTSWESSGCVQLPIRVEAYVAVPVGATNVPGIVVAHGLGGYADSDSASTPAAELGAITLAYSGPGCGASEGTTSTPDHLFDTTDDPRDSWFWEHSVAAIRGLTVLEGWAGVDPTRLAMTGYSGGAVATWMVAGVDERLVAAVPVSGTGHLDLAIAATPNPGWEYDLLQAMSPPRTAADPEWVAYQRWLDPKNYLATLHADVLLIDGAQDEFFPLPSAVMTLTEAQAVRPDSRLLMIPNWDHGWYAYFTGDAAQALGVEGLAAWMGHTLGTASDLADTPGMPQIDGVGAWTCYDPANPWFTWSCAVVAASVPGASAYAVESATFWFSVDDALTFASWNLQDIGGGVWAAEVGTLDGAVYSSSNTVWFVDFELSTGAFGHTFHLTSLPSLPPGFSPYILPVDGPFP